MAIEKLCFLDEVGTQQLAEAILSKTNERIAERIVQEVNDASDHDHVPSALLLNALLKVRDQQISDNKTDIDGNKTSIYEIKENVTTLEGNVTSNSTGITGVTEEITKLSDKVDAFTHLTIDVVIGTITDIQNPSTEILYLQKDDESATIWSLWIYREDSTWIRIGDTSIDLSGYWKKTDVDSIKGEIEVPDVTPMGDKEIQDIVEKAFINTDVMKPATPETEDFIITSSNRSMVGFKDIDNEELIIPETFTGDDGVLYKVVGIELAAFMAASKLKSITIPNTVTSIGTSAFSYCSNLLSVDIPDSVTKMHTDGMEERGGMFKNCTSLKNVTIRGNVSIIEGSAFEGCASLESVSLPNTIKTIKKFAFADCTNLRSIVLPNDITEIERGTFGSCESLTSITIPNTITTIREGTFTGCISLVSINVSDNIISIESNAFAGCTGLTEINLPNSVTSIHPYAFNGCDSLRNINIDNIEDAIPGAGWGATGPTNINWLR